MEALLAECNGEGLLAGRCCGGWLASHPVTKVTPPVSPPLELAHYGTTERTQCLSHDKAHKARVGDAWVRLLNLGAQNSHRLPISVVHNGASYRHLAPIPEKRMAGQVLLVFPLLLGRHPQQHL